MAGTRSRARRRAERAELATLLKFFPHFPDPSWYERYWYDGGKKRRRSPAATLAAARAFRACLPRFLFSRRDSGCAPGLAVSRR
ncbi:MAG TPA: hypothetical protein VM755_09310 [Stellaceae bacterium]|nr:hypothetical protein [Stellaceae bacterium]